MSTWLIDTPLFNLLGTLKAKPLLEWYDANDPSLFISAASLTEIVAGVGKTPASQSRHGDAQRRWLNEITTRFADRIHPVDAAVATRAGALLQRLTSGSPRHRFHDSLLVATTQDPSHGPITRRDGIFGPWTQTPIATI